VKKVRDAAEDAGDALKKAGKDVKDAAKDATNRWFRHEHHQL